MIMEGGQADKDRQGDSNIGVPFMVPSVTDATSTVMASYVVACGNLVVLLESIMIAGIEARSIFDVAHHFERLPGPHVGALKRIFAVSGKEATCSVGKELANEV